MEVLCSWVRYLSFLLLIAALYFKIFKMFVYLIAISVFNDWLKPWDKIYKLTAFYTIMYTLWYYLTFFSIHQSNAKKSQLNHIAFESNTTEYSESSVQNLCGYKFGMVTTDKLVFAQVPSFSVSHVVFVRLFIVLAIHSLGIFTCFKYQTELNQKRNTDQFYKNETDLNDCHIGFRDFMNRISMRTRMKPFGFQSLEVK